MHPVRTVPTDVAEHYRAAGLWTGETFSAFIDERTTRWGPRTAVVGVDATGAPTRWTYGQLSDAADRAWQVVADAGVTAGDRVVVALPNIVEFVAVTLGLLRHGAVPVFGLPTHRDVEIAHFCDIADAAALVVATHPGGPDGVELHRAVSARVVVAPPALIDLARTRLADAPAATPTPRRRPADAAGIALLQLSGGTTGLSKLIPRTHDDYLYSVRASADICALTAQSVMLIALPAVHNFVMSSPGILGVLHAGGAIVLAPDPSPATVFRLIAAEGVTIAAAVPPLAQAWISSARRRRPDLSTLEVLQVGGARLSDAVAADVEPVLGARLQQVFGMAEGLVNYTRLDDPEDLVVTTQGRPISDLDDVVVVDDDDRPVDDGNEGHLLTRGPYTIRGYYRAPHADADSFTAEGFYRTGDLVRRLPSGHLVVTGRAKDQINRAGEKIATDELERLALAHPGVLDAVAVGAPDAFLGERIVLVVQRQPGAELPDLRAHFSDAGLAAFKTPDDVIELDTFPITHVGKNSRRELRRILADRFTERAPL